MKHLDILLTVNIVYHQYKGLRYFSIDIENLNLIDAVSQIKYIDKF